MTAYRRLKYETLEKENRHHWNIVLIDRALGKKQTTSILKVIHPQGVTNMALCLARLGHVMSSTSAAKDQAPGSSEQGLDLHGKPVDLHWSLCVVGTAWTAPLCSLWTNTPSVFTTPTSLTVTQASHGKRFYSSQTGTQLHDTAPLVPVWHRRHHLSCCRATVRSLMRANIMTC